MSQLQRFKKFEWFVEAKKQGQGACFGELALEATDPQKQRRQATVVAHTSCEFAVLSREDYLKILKKVEAKETNNRANFLAKIPFFQSMSFNKVKKLTQYFVNEEVLRLQYLYRQGQRPTHIYIVVKGDFEILRKNRRQLSMVDPTKTNTSDPSRNLSSENASTYLGPHVREKSFEKGKLESTGSGMPQSQANNSLR